MPPCSPVPALNPAMPHTASPMPGHGRTATLRRTNQPTHSACSLLGSHFVTTHQPAIRPTPPCSVLCLGFYPPTITTHKKPRRKHRTPTHFPQSSRNQPTSHPRQPTIHTQSTHNQPFTAQHGQMKHNPSYVKLRKLTSNLT